MSPSKSFIFIIFVLFSFCSFAQSTFPVYTDYLSDNIFLIHPSAAGIGNCAKLRLTHRQQWFDVSEAPSLETLSFHSKITDKAAIGTVLFNDKNGFHSQKGISLAYAYHLNFGREDALNQLSFGLSFALVNNKVDHSSFSSPLADPSNTQLIESKNYFDADFSMAYHYIDAYSYFTIKNLILNITDADNNTFQSLNLRRYLLTFGYYFGQSKNFQFEPSIMGQLIERTGEVFVDFNFKMYKNLEVDKQLWVVISYRQNFEQNTIEGFKQISPILGLNYKKFMVSYTYTHYLGNIVIDNGGFHQITIGMNLFCKAPRPCGCGTPNVNTIF